MFPSAKNEDGCVESEENVRSERIPSAKNATDPSVVCKNAGRESFGDFMSQFSQSCTKTLRQHLLQPQPKQGSRCAASLQDEGLNTNAVNRARAGADSSSLWQLF